MDNLTHTLFALTLVNAGVGRRDSGATATLLLSSSAPDIDIVTAFTGGAVKYLAEHRGPSHGPIGLLALATLTASLVRICQRREQWGQTSLVRLWTIAVLGVVCHVLMDYPTSYRTRLWDPFSMGWWGFDWLPIIDVYLLAVLFLGLAAAEIRPRYRGPVAAVVLLLMLANYGLRATVHAAVLREARQAAPPARLLVDAAAIPTFFSPFRWRIIRQYSDGYELSELDLLKRTPLSPVPDAGRSVWVPDEENDWIARARQSAAARVFLDFSRFPAARTFSRPDGIVVVRWVDLRFVGGITRLTTEAGRNNLFVATVHLSPDGRILSDGLGAAEH